MQKAKAGMMTAIGLAGAMVVGVAVAGPGGGGPAQGDFPARLERGDRRRARGGHLRGQ